MLTVVTGGAGFIGSNLVEALVKQGREVIVVDDMSRGVFENLDGLNVPVRVADLRDYAQTRRALGGMEIDTLFHMAARIGNESYLHGEPQNEITVMKDNITIDSNLMLASLVECKVGTMVYASSSAVYPTIKQTQHGAVLRETDCTGVDAEGGYGKSKLFGEYLLRTLSGIRKGIARIFNAYGEKSSIVRYPHVVTTFLLNSMEGRDVVVYGDGKQTRDFVYVSDCVGALLALEMRANNKGVVCNIGSGVPISISSLAEDIVQLNGSHSRVVYSGVNNPSSPVSRTADIERANDVLGWKPKMTLKDGLIKTHEWIKKERMAK